MNDPKYIQHQLKNYPAQAVFSNGLRGYLGQWDGVMQALPDFNIKNGYSYNVTCVSAVMGDDARVLHTRFCAPDTKIGNVLIKKYRSIIMKIKVTGP